MLPVDSLHNYDSFLQTVSRKQWEKIGLQRRAGVAVPLFSLYSKESIGIGELPDLEGLMNWCEQTGLSIIQLLPLNDVGFNFTPYDAQSNFALDPMYLSFTKLRLSQKNRYKKEVEDLRRRFPTGSRRLDYRIKGAKFNLLWRIFEAERYRFTSERNDFIRENQFWIHDYAVFKAIKTSAGERKWEDWEAGLKAKDPESIRRFCEKYAHEVEFQRWLQWQLYEQFLDVKRGAAKRGVFLMGDLPFLVARDSADVWAHQDYFKLDHAAGAPPDLYFSNGQRWGMPPYDWEKMAQKDYDYLREKLRYAGNFYDFFRIDHAVGVFRVWTIPLSEPPESGGRNGVFDPSDETVWEEHGRELLTFMLQHTKMLPCAEDLGTVPDCSYTVLEDFAIPGSDVQRWSKDWKKTFDFTKPGAYRKNSIAIISTHDMTTFRGWWQTEVDTFDEALFKRLCEDANLTFEEVKNALFDLEHSYHGRLRWKREIRDVKTLLTVLERPEEQVLEIVKGYRGSYGEMRKFWKYVGMPGKCQENITADFSKRTLECLNASASIFSIQLLQDWLAMEGGFAEDPWDDRINLPGSKSEKNWSWITPWSLEEMLMLKGNLTIKEILKRTDRLSKGKGD